MESAAGTFHQSADLMGDPIELGAQVQARVISPLATTIYQHFGLDGWMKFEAALLAALLTEVALTVGPGIATHLATAAAKTARDQCARLSDQPLPGEH